MRKGTTQIVTSNAYEKTLKKGPSEYCSHLEGEEGDKGDGAAAGLSLSEGIALSFAVFSAPGTALSPED